MSKQTTYDKVKLLGVEIDVITMPEAIDYILKLSDTDTPPGYVTKPYVEFLDQAARQSDIRDLLNNSDLTLADGVALVWATAYLYAGPRTGWRFWRTLVQIVASPGELRWPLVDRAAGTNFTWPLLEAAAKAGRRVYLVGSPQGGSIEHTAEVIRAGITDIQIVGTHSGDDPGRLPNRQSEAWLDTLLADIQGSDADIILLGLGFPRQEYATAYLTAHADHGVFIGEGGTFDYERFGGRRPKAPAAMQHLGLEWLWRLLKEPRRLRRQLAIPRFIFRIWRSRGS
jgi:N-acetylglucosaminyldiphosphoundecaprenol N-acetyl-beta-D-mannosaminyltransferase